MRNSELMFWSARIQIHQLTQYLGYIVDLDEGFRRQFIFVVSSSTTRLNSGEISSLFGDLAAFVTFESYLKHSWLSVRLASVGEN